METMELPVTGERDETATVPIDFAEQEMDIAAFELWRDASILSEVEEENAGAQRERKP